MTDLQIALIFLGFIIIIGVVVYNWRQEKKWRDTIHNGFASPEQDVLTENFGSKVLDEMGIQASEPILDENPTKTPVADNVETTAPLETPDIVTPPIIASPVNNSETPTLEAKTAEATLPSDINTQIDLTAILTTPNAIDSHALYTRIDDIGKELGVLVLQHGLDKNSIWHRIDSMNNQIDAFEAIACSLQLVSRRGPVTKALINKFECAIEAIGLEFDVKVEWRDEGDAAQRAVALDQFCIEVDQVVSVYVLQGDTPIHGTKFKGMAEANGLKLRHGKFYCMDTENPDLVKYVLTSTDEQSFSVDWLRQNIVKGVVFQIEIPKVANVELIFNQMIIVAQQMATNLSANLVDGDQRPLGVVQIDKIKQQLKMIDSKMTARGIAAGSACSMRLFN